MSPFFMNLAAPANDVSVANADSSSSDSRYLWAAVLFTLFLVSLYAAYTGLYVTMGDSFLLANRSKHVADQFNLNLNNGFAPLVYPPLYPVVLAFAYRFDDPAAIFRVTLGIHVLLTASQVFPLFLLLRHYALLAPRAAAVLAAALALAPASLPYTSIMLTEVLYGPFLLWLSYFVFRAFGLNERMKFIGVGVSMAACMMTRSAASTVLLALVMTAVYFLWKRRDSSDLRRGLAFAVLAFIGVYGGWSLLERLFVQYEGFVPQFELSEVAGVVVEGKRLDLHANWFSNCFFYLLTAPLSLAGAFTFVLCLRRPRTLFADPVAVFFLLSTLVSAAVISLVTADYWGGKDLTWNRYVMPYVVFTSIIAIRYRASFNRSTLFLSSLVLGMAVLSFHPSNLACHFTDALAVFGTHRPFKIADVVVNLVYFAGTVAAGWFWLRNGSGRTVAAAITAVMWLSTHAVAAYAYHNSGDQNITQYNGIGATAYRIYTANPGSKIFYDRKFTSKDSFSALRLLYYWPDLMIQQLAAKELPEQTVAGNAKLLFLTTDVLTGHEPLGMERGEIKLYEFDAAKLAEMKSGASAPPAAIAFHHSANFPVAEVGEKDGKKYPVRWLRQDLEFSIESALPEVDLRLDVASPNGARTIQLMVDGVPTPEKYVVEGNFWSSPETEAVFRIKLKPGPNKIVVHSSVPPSKLSDGREVTFLLIGDPRATQPRPVKAAK